MYILGAILSALISLFCLIAGPIVGTFAHLTPALSFCAWTFWIIPALIARSAIEEGRRAKKRKELRGQGKAKKKAPGSESEPGTEPEKEAPKDPTPAPESFDDKKDAV